MGMGVPNDCIIGSFLLKGGWTARRGLEAGVAVLQLWYPRGRPSLHDGHIPYTANVGGEGRPTMGVIREQLGALTLNDSLIR